MQKIHNGYTLYREDKLLQQWTQSQRQSLSPISKDWQLNTYICLSKRAAWANTEKWTRKEEGLWIRQNQMHNAGSVTYYLSLISSWNHEQVSQWLNLFSCLWNGAKDPYLTWSLWGWNEIVHQVLAHWLHRWSIHYSLTVYPLTHLNSFRAQLKPIYTVILMQRLPARIRTY